MSEILIKGATIFLLLPLTFILSTHTIDVLRGRRKIKRGLLSQIISTLFALIIIAISALIVIQIFFVSPKKDTKKVLTALLLITANYLPFLDPIQEIIRIAFFSMVLFFCYKLFKNRNKKS